jgi:hypothetical protein
MFLNETAARSEETHTAFASPDTAMVHLFIIALVH